MTNSSASTPSYWRVIFDNGPVNLLDRDTIDQLGELVDRAEADPDLTVIVFRSEKPGFFMAHWDFTADKEHLDTATLPADAEFGPALAAFFTTARRPENRPYTRQLVANGLQQPHGIELDLGAAIARIRQSVNG